MREFSTHGFKIRVCRCGAGLGRCLARYLMASYAYYILDETIMPDHEYDALARTLLEGWDRFEHMHKHLVREDDLRAGTLYRLTAKDYPGMVKGAVTHKLYEMGRNR